MGTEGWPLGDVDEFPGATPDPVNGAKHIKDLYLRVNPEYDGRCIQFSQGCHVRMCTYHIPGLLCLSFWDKQKGTIVNNESSEIIRIFNTAFNDQLPEAKAKIDIYPESLRAQIDEVNEWVYDSVNSNISLLTGEGLISDIYVQMAFTRQGLLAHSRPTRRLSYRCLNPLTNSRKC